MISPLTFVRPSNAVTRAAMTGLLLAATAGCAGEPEVEASTVLSYNQCQGLEPGAARVSYDDVADIRGSRLIRTTEPRQPTEGASPQGPEPVGDAPQAPSGSAADAPLLVAVSRGRQPTPGYGFRLEGAHRRGTTAVVTVQWDTPEPDAVLAQMITYPCLVVALPKADFTRVEVVDPDGETVGSVDL